MESVFSNSGRELLFQIVSSNVLLAFDYDGTLAPIAERPELAVMRDRTRRLLQSLSEVCPCVVISGRSQTDVITHVDDVDVWEVIGNHGIEPGASCKAFEDDCKRWAEILNRELAGLPGCIVEDKRYSLAVHYRQCEDRAAAKAAVLAAVEALPGVRIITGKLVINIVPESAPHKGKALEWVRERFGCDTALYVGDDVTDEDVFRLSDPARLMTIRVGRNEKSAASFFLESQRDVDVLLEELLRLRVAAKNNSAPANSEGFGERADLVQRLRED